MDAFYGKYYINVMHWFICKVSYSCGVLHTQLKKLNIAGGRD